MSRRARTFGALVGLAVLAGCSTAFLDEFFIDTSGTIALWESRGITISNFEEWGQSATQRLNGTVELFGTATVTIEGRGAHEVEAFAFIEPPERGNRRTLFTTDLETGREHGFHYEIDDNAVVFGDAEGGVFAFANPDGSYEVVTSRFDAPASEDEFVHADGYEVFHLVQAYNEFPADSPYALALATSMGFGPQKVADSRSSSICEEPFGCPGADAPSICSSFPELCDCLLCVVAGETEGETCSQCVPN